MTSETEKNKLILILAHDQLMHCYEDEKCIATYRISTAKNGLGELEGSECTPRGWHSIHNIIGLDNVVNSVFVGRVWTGEVYSETLAAQSPHRDWILTRILQLEGLEPGRNQGGDVDSLKRYIYLHGTPDSTPLGIPGSHGCVRMSNEDIIVLAKWANIKTRVYVE